MSIHVRRKDSLMSGSSFAAVQTPLAPGRDRTTPCANMNWWMIMCARLFPCNFWMIRALWSNIIKIIESTTLAMTIIVHSTSVLEDQ